MKTRHFVFAAAIALVSAGAANAAPVTKNFTFNDLSNSPIVTGSFTYDSSLVGDVSYGSLSAFNISLGLPHPASFDLNFVNTADQYVYFDYNPVSNQFVAADVNGYQGFFGELMGAIQGQGSSGFFLDPLTNMAIDGNDGIFCTYGAGGGCNGNADYGFVGTYAVTDASTNEAVPEPLTLSIFGAGLAGAAALRRRKKKVA